MRALLDRIADPDLQEESLEPSLTWVDHVDAARDELRDMERTYRDDLAMERKLRLECLDRAQMAIDAARAMLEPCVPMADQATARRLRDMAMTGVRRG